MAAGSLAQQARLDDWRLQQAQSALGFQRTPGDGRSSWRLMERAGPSCRTTFSVVQQKTVSYQVIPKVIAVAGMMDASSVTGQFSDQRRLQSVKRVWK